MGADDETYAGRGATQDDGRLMALLTDGEREMRVSKVAFPDDRTGGPRCCWPRPIGPLRLTGDYLLK